MGRGSAAQLGARGPGPGDCDRPVMDRSLCPAYCCRSRSVIAELWRQSWLKAFSAEFFKAFPQSPAFSAGRLLARAPLLEFSSVTRHPGARFSASTPRWRTPLRSAQVSPQLSPHLNYRSQSLLPAPPQRLFSGGRAQGARTYRPGLNYPGFVTATYDVPIVKGLAGKHLQPQQQQRQLKEQT
ncbi:hypothetical protein SKAU_G00362300 [Synaphobranchus kaupii]|uniref:Uncharacterized protein n=1 Tax=Synaphobranchus kaupii TaxID=118154 RepID=A0A9Q1EIJ7_SYNKA|nr:hypothetical protein SKAU_G00362300 [Synaphobranchus kaupii]